MKDLLLSFMFIGMAAASLAFAFLALLVPPLALAITGVVMVFVFGWASKILENQAKAANLPRWLRPTGGDKVYTAPSSICPVCGTMPDKLRKSADAVDYVCANGHSWPEAKIEMYL